MSAVTSYSFALSSYPVAIMSYPLIVKRFKDTEVRVTDESNDVWMYLDDMKAIFGDWDPTETLKSCRVWTLKTDTRMGNAGDTYIRETNVYILMMESDLREFYTWLVAEVSRTC